MNRLVILNLLFWMSSSIISGLNNNKTGTNLINQNDTIHQDSIHKERIGELNEIASKHIGLVRENYIKNGTFLPVAFIITTENKFQTVVYNKHSKTGTLSTEYVYQKLYSILKKEYKKNEVRMTCIIYNGTIKNEKYPNGNQCITFKFNSKEIENSVTINYAVKVYKGELRFGDTFLQFEKKE